MSVGLYLGSLSLAATLAGAKRRGSFGTSQVEVLSPLAEASVVKQYCRSSFPNLPSVYLSMSLPNLVTPEATRGGDCSVAQ
jgi:hypothetical protein